jgi:hypothetical protein
MLDPVTSRCNLSPMYLWSVLSQNRIGHSYATHTLAKYNSHGAPMYSSYDLPSLQLIHPGWPYYDRSNYELPSSPGIIVDEVIDQNRPCMPALFTIPPVRFPRYMEVPANQDHKSPHLNHRPSV